MITRCWKKEEKLPPSHTLDGLHMAIVVRVSPVKLLYIYASGIHVAHPHLGATDKNGVFGYVQYVMALCNDCYLSKGVRLTSIVGLGCPLNCYY
jgi:hypothetical protein